MHIYDTSKNFQGGWALVSEQLPYAVGAARSILLDRQLDPEGTKKDDRITIVFIGYVLPSFLPPTHLVIHPFIYPPTHPPTHRSPAHLIPPTHPPNPHSEGGAQNGRMAECLNAAAKEGLPILFLVIDNGRVSPSPPTHPPTHPFYLLLIPYFVTHLSTCLLSFHPPTHPPTHPPSSPNQQAINTFTPDVAANSDVYKAGQVGFFISLSQPTHPPTHPPTHQSFCSLSIYQPID